LSLQARIPSGGETRLYNPSRDVAHNFKFVIEAVAGRLEDHHWSELQTLLWSADTHTEDVADACVGFCDYLVSAATDPKKTMADGLRDSGFLSCKPAAQVAVMAMIGQYYAGMQHVGIREATVAGEGPLEDVKSLLAGGQQFTDLCGRSTFSRFCGACSQKVRAFFKKR
jgi:hypothetical protein